LKYHNQNRYIQSVQNEPFLPKSAQKIRPFFSPLKQKSQQLCITTGKTSGLEDTDFKLFFGGFTAHY